MKTFGSIRRSVGWAWILAGVGLSLAGAGHDLLAQESETQWVPRERARIGILLEERCEGPATAEAVCDKPPVVTSVVVGGPADRAGVLARDTLLSVNGLDVRGKEGRALLLGLEAGTSVELQVGREGGRKSIEVVPEMRPEEAYVDVRTMFFEPRGGVDEDQHRVQVVRIPSVRARRDEVELRLDSLRTHGNGFVFFSEDSAGSFRIEVGDPEKAHVFLQRIREQEAEESVRPSRRPGGSATEADGGTDWTEHPRYVWENEELARRLEQVRDSSFQSARVQLDSLIRLRGQVRVLEGDSLGLALSVTSRAAPDGEWAYYVTPRPMSGQLRTLLSSDLRLAGAEFRELTPDLAEYFDGAEQGLLVLRVIPETPAARIGLKGGDVVVEAGGTRCKDMSTLREAIAGADPGTGVQVKWLRKGVLHTGNLPAR